MKKLHTALGSAALALAIGIGGALHAGAFTAHAAPPAGKTRTIMIVEKNDKYAFGALKATVKVGTRVTWMNKTDAPHTVTGTGGWTFSSKTFNENQSVSFVFKKAGTYHYDCAIHPFMKATVVVTK